MVWEVGNIFGNNDIIKANLLFLIKGNPEACWIPDINDVIRALSLQFVHSLVISINFTVHLAVLRITRCECNDVVYCAPMTCKSLESMPCLWTRQEVRKGFLNRKQKLRWDHQKVAKWKRGSQGKRLRLWRLPRRREHRGLKGLKGIQLLQGVGIVKE